MILFVFIFVHSFFENITKGYKFVSHHLFSIWSIIAHLIYFVFLCLFKYIMYVSTYYTDIQCTYQYNFQWSISAVYRDLFTVPYTLSTLADFTNLVLIIIIIFITILALFGRDQCKVRCITVSFNPSHYYSSMVKAVISIDAKRFA